MHHQTLICDTLVIGGGTAGAAIAGRLAAKATETVVLLEAGPDYGRLDGGQWPRDLVDGRVVAVASHDWQYTSAARYGAPHHRLERARVLGGCSAHNGSIAIWGSRVDYDGWSALGNPGWSTADLLPYFHQANDRLRVRHFAPTEITPFHAACLEAMQQGGLPSVADLNNLEEDCGVAPAPVNIVGDMRWNTAFAYLDPVRQQPQLTILGNSLVDKLQIGQGKVTGVVVVGAQGRQTIRPGRVIVCAGAYGSPALLLRSGIGPAAELRDLGIQPLLDLPGVGRNLHDHPAIYLQYDAAAHLDGAMNAFVAAGHTLFTEQSLAKVQSEQCATAFDLHFYPCSNPTPDASGHWAFVWPVANMTPQSRGTVRLGSADPTVAPLIDTGYLTDPNNQDVDVLLSGIKLARQVMQQAGLAARLGRETLASQQIVDRESVRRACLHYYHPVGSCKMGPDADPLAVVNARGQVYGVENLYVADASIMPVIPRANTNLPTLVVAERVVSWL